MTENPNPSAMAQQDPLEPLRKLPADQPFVIAQLGQTLDGRIATINGESRWINRDAALDHLHRLRALVDAVVVGVGTVVTDDPSLTVRRVSGTNPARVIIDPNGKLTANAKCLSHDGSCRRIVIGQVRHDLPEGVEFVTLGAQQGLHSPLDIVAALGSIGLRRLLIEGGATTISMFIDANAVDRLHFLVAPMLLGSGKSGLTLKPINNLSAALRPATEVHVLTDGDVLFDCDLRSRR